jgi:hypothetical protein
MNELERHYCAAMRWYTAKRRRSNGDALLSTLVDQAEADGRHHPTVAELRNLARTGIRQRAFAAVP